MTNRRRFIQTLAAIPPAYAMRNAWAAPDPSRLALIIGNSSYHDAPLVNPANDAKAVGGLFTQAGFTVDSHLNAKRTDMLAAIEKFGAAAKRSETKLVVFYYAGHGAQLDWRNYLLPVDAVVQRQEDMKQRCVDLSLLLGQFSAAKDKTFIIILDACRNNPFGTSYRPDQKGLSQFDAPVGSLLAYATSPGNVASDGEGANGLYTENLVRELSRRGTRIEDALKRVRLNVRLASKGEQIPWETTSLEGDVFIFNEDQKKLSESEMEKLLEADITEWTRIKSSKKIDDWTGYLRAFPNGRFAEIAQMRLTRLLADVEKQRVELQQQDTAKADKLAAEKRQEDEKRKQEEQKRLEQERIEREKIRVAEVQRLAAERKQLEEQQAAEQRRRQEEQQRIELKRREEQERLDRERQRIAEAERQAAEHKKQEQQRQQAAQELAERERMRIAEVQRLAAERKRLEEQQAAEARRREEEQKAIEAKRRLEQERLDRERQRIADAERVAVEKRKQEEQRQLAAQERTERERLRLAEAQRLDAERKKLEEQQAAELKRRQEEQQAAELKRRQEQERLERERQRIAEAERLAEERKKKDEEQRQLASQERIERERLRATEEKRLVTERKQYEEHQLQEQRRRQEEQQAVELKRKQEQERLDRERQRITEAERQAAERKQQDEQRLAAGEQKRKEQEKLAAMAKPAPVPAAAAKPAAPAKPGGFIINIGAGLPVPTLMAPSDNPFSAGRYPLGRIFTVGDEATVRRTDILTGVEESTRTVRVTKVDYDEDRVEFGNGMAITDLMGNALKLGPFEFNTPVQFVPAEFQVGKKWTAAFGQIMNGVASQNAVDLKIVQRETITVPAGSFDTFRIEGDGWNLTFGTRMEMKIWLVPGLNFTVKSEQVRRNKFGRYVRTERDELVALRQQATDIRCAVSGAGLKRTLTIQSGCS